MKWRKKPVVIEAVQFKIGLQHEALCRCGQPSDFAQPGGPAHIHTLEGMMLVSEGDWIIRGVKGEFYPCKPDIFAATYEPADLGVVELSRIEQTGEIPLTDESAP